MDKSILQALNALFLQWTGSLPTKLEALPLTTSNRLYFRLYGQDLTAIATWNDNPTENASFLYLSRHFKSLGLPVPEIYAESENQRAYLQEDLGSTSLFDVITEKRKNAQIHEGFWGETYEPVIRDMIRFQCLGQENLDFAHCYPTPQFSAREIHWDLNYFKHYFLKLAGIPFHEGRLQDGFDALVNEMIDVPTKGFMYRDFQARNIMLKDDLRYYIDYQGGRFGPLAYDLASLLFNTKADIPFDAREKLLLFYMDELKQFVAFNEAGFVREYYAFALLRVMQAMGAYGYRGYFERKPYFLSGIPFGQQNLKWLLENTVLPINEELSRVLKDVASSSKLAALSEPGLNLTIHSFSYKRGIPADLSGNGGGFVFDCRILPNPGRFDEYQQLTGRDEAVREYLMAQDEVSSFLHHVKEILTQGVQNYLSRGFTHLSVHFGCTGGRHRSVFCAEEIAGFLRESYSINVQLAHLELDGLPR